MIVARVAAAATLEWRRRRRDDDDDRARRNDDDDEQRRRRRNGITLIYSAPNSTPRRAAPLLGVPAAQLAADL